MICYFFCDDDIMQVEQIVIFDFVEMIECDCWGLILLVGLQMVVVIFDKLLICICVSFVVGIVDFGGSFLIILIVNS